MSNHDGFRLLDMFANQRGNWLLAWLLSMVTALSVMGLLMLSGWFITAAATAGMLALGSHAFNYLVPAALIRILAMLRTAGRYGEMLVSHQAVFRVLQRLRVQFFDCFARLPLTSLSTTLQSSHAMHRLTHDIDILNEFPLRVVSPWLIVVVATGLLATLCGYFFTNVWLIGLLFLASIGLPAALAWRGIRQAESLQQLAESRRVSLLNPLSALTHLLIWQQWQTSIQPFISINEQHCQYQQKTQRFQSVTSVVIHWLMAGGVVAILWQFFHGYLAVGVPTLLAVLLGVFGLTELVLPLVTHYLAWGNSISAKHRLNALLSPAPTSQNPLGNATPASVLNDTPLTLQIQNLTAKLPQALVGVTDVNFTVTAGRPLLITGRSGVGKSTLLQVLARELLPTQGAILLNDVDWFRLPISAQLIGYLGQQLDIFDQTLASNLRLGKADATDAELWQVLDQVGLKDWAKAQPAQLDTPLGEYGHAISGGQARRIALARLFLTPKRVLLLDEPFAGLDAISREQLWHCLVNQQRHGLLVIVTHQLWQTIEHVDRLVLPEPRAF